MKSFKQVNQKDINQIKSLLATGIEVVKIVKFTGRAYSTIQLIVKAKDLADYKRLVHEEGLRHKKKVMPETNGHAQPAPRVVSDEVIVVLWDISTQLKRLADAWEKPNQHLVERMSQAS